MGERVAPCGDPRSLRLRAVLFDFDGTLTRPEALNFTGIKRELGCPPEQFLLEWIQGLPRGARKEHAFAALERFERRGAAASTPNEGAEELVRELRARGLLLGIVTRNSLAAVQCALERFALLTEADFHVIVSRDDDAALKPAPDSVLLAARMLGVAPAETLMVGDYIIDVQAGRAAGTVTAYLTNEGGGGETREHPPAALCDVVVHRLTELSALVRLGQGAP